MRLFAGSALYGGLIVHPFIHVSGFLSGACGWHFLLDTALDGELVNVSLHCTGTLTIVEIAKVCCMLLSVYLLLLVSICSLLERQVNTEISSFRRASCTPEG